ncbi:MAG: hypothetical protein LBP29_10465, partial [Treponema sp.]|nr:hypothetical protein [Treponema sp.]
MTILKIEVFMKRFPVFLLIFLFLVPAGYPADLFAPAPDPYGGLGRSGDAVPVMEDMLTGTLPNGLT